MERVCKLCGKPIPESRTSPNTKYCSLHCQRRAGLTKDVRTKIIERGRRKSKLNRNLLQAYGGCAICGWSIPSWKPGYERHEPSYGCHVHHIINVCDGGSEESHNLILLCPNCHKMAHVGLLSKEKLREHVLTDDMIEKRVIERRLKFAAEYLIDDMF